MVLLSFIGHHLLGQDLPRRKVHCRSSNNLALLRCRQLRLWYDGFEFDEVDFPTVIVDNFFQDWFQVIRRDSLQLTSIASNEIRVYHER